MRAHAMAAFLAIMMLAALVSIGCSGRDSGQSAAGRENAADSALADARVDQAEAVPDEAAPPERVVEPRKGDAPNGPRRDRDEARGSEDDRADRQSEERRTEERRPEPMTVPSGSEIHVTLNGSISTAEAHPGSDFSASVSQAVLVRGRVAVPQGAMIRGDVTEAKRAARVGGGASLALAFREVILPDGSVYPLSAAPMRLEGKSTASGDLQKVLGGAVGGAMIGGILGGKKGAAKGAGAGAAAGGVWAVATRGHDIVLEPGTAMIVSLNQSLTIPESRYAEASP